MYDINLMPLIYGTLITERTLHKQDKKKKHNLQKETT